MPFHVQHPKCGPKSAQKRIPVGSEEDEDEVVELVIPPLHERNNQGSRTPLPPIPPALERNNQGGHFPLPPALPAHEGNNNGSHGLLPPILRYRDTGPQKYRAYVRPKDNRRGRLAPPEGPKRKPRRGHSGSKSGPGPGPAPTPASTSNLACAWCHGPWETNEGLFWQLRCGHLMDTRCYCEVAKIRLDFCCAHAIAADAHIGMDWDH
ncbi:hypothetical protein FRC07_010984 [Ceratobasidium sp. 392]|nr:hypothetical protein FRC07_010984 [Ceratobasidium sp. 392]